MRSSRGWRPARLRSVRQAQRLVFEKSEVDGAGTAPAVDVEQRGERHVVAVGAAVTEVRDGREESDHPLGQRLDRRRSDE